MGLEAILQEEAALIRSGAFVEAGRLTALKATAATDLPARGLAELFRLKALAKRNGTLLEAAAGGVRSVLHEIEGRPQGGAVTGTYAADGRVRQIGKIRSSLQLRA